MSTNEKPVELREEDCKVLLRFRADGRKAPRRLTPHHGEAIVFKRLVDHGLIRYCSFANTYQLTPAGATVLAAIATTQGSN